MSVEGEGEKKKKISIPSLWEYSTAEGYDKGETTMS